MKDARKSRTLWFNLITLLTAAAAGIAGSDVIVQYPQAAAGIAATVATLNIILRFITTQPLK